MVISCNFESDLQKLIDCDGFELFIKNSGIVYIPYMMSDAVECYFRLDECRITGQWDADSEEKVEFSLVENGNTKGLILRQGYSNTVTIWYNKMEKHLELYQYHRIAHLWVRGQEKWRRLVYIVGTLYDKMQFIGPQFCCNEEMMLVGLMEFAPFRYWTPIHESLDDYYQSTKNGITAMYAIANASKNEKLMNLILRYTSDFSKGTLSARKIRRYARQLLKNQELYDYINGMIDTASQRYDVRRYSKELEDAFDIIKEKAMDAYRKKGYEGSYPVLQKNKRKILFYEEHPYVMTDFEYEDYDFKINIIEE